MNAADPAPRVALVPLGLLTMATLAFEVFLTRLLAYTVHALLIYFVLGIAMLGFGAAGSLVAVRAGWTARERVPAVVAAWTAAFAVLLVGSCGAFARLAPTLTSEVGWRATAVAAILTAPFLASGVVVTLALSTAEGRLGRVYAVDLLGSGLGCFLPLALLGPLSGERLLGVLAVTGSVAAALFVHRVRGRSRALRAFVWAAVGVAVLAVAAAPAVFPLVPDPSGQVAAIERTSRRLGFDVEKVFDRWNLTGRVEVYEYHDVDGTPGLYPYRFYAQDNTAGAIMARWDGLDVRAAPPGESDPPPVVRMCNDTFFGQAYFEPRIRVLVIGVGGGADVQCALYHRAESIDAVEINPDAIRALRKFDGWLGGIASDERVRYRIQDGRSFVHAARDRDYDLIQLSGVDTKHFLASGALPLSENHLYTKEAFVDYLESLAPGGVLSIIRFGEGEAMRLFNTAIRALEELGARHPPDHVLAAENGLAFGILVRREPFPKRIVEAYEKRLWFDDRPYVGLRIAFLSPFDYMAHQRPVLIYTPGNARPPMLAAFLEQYEQRGGDTGQFEKAYRYAISPVDDDRPFFFDLTRYDLPAAAGARHVRVLSGLVITVLSLAAILILAPVWCIRRVLVGWDRWTAPTFFSGVGAAYLLVEIWLLHRFAMFLGHQSYSLTIVLATLLVGTGCGALFSQRVPGPPRRRALIGVGGAMAAVALMAVLLPRVLEFAWRAPLSVRMLVAIAFVAPAGFAMGFPFPAGVEWSGRRTPAATPWCVGINFFAAVVASSVAIPVSLLHGYAVLGSAGAACYAMAGVAAFGLRFRGGENS